MGDPGGFKKFLYFLCSIILVLTTYGQLLLYISYGYEQNGSRVFYMLLELPPHSNGSVLVSRGQTAFFRFSLGGGNPKEKRKKAVWPRETSSVHRFMAFHNTRGYK